MGGTTELNISIASAKIKKSNTDKQYVFVRFCKLDPWSVFDKQMEIRCRNEFKDYFYSIVNNPLKILW